MNPDTLATLLSELYAKTQQWETGTNKYTDLLLLAEYRSQIRTLRAELRTLIKNQLIEATSRINLVALVRNTTLAIDTLIAKYMYGLIAEAQGSIPEKGVPSKFVFALQTVVYQLLSIIELGIESEDTLLGIAHEAIEIQDGIGQQHKLSTMVGEVLAAIVARGQKYAGFADKLK